MKKTIKTIGLTLSMLLIFSVGTKIINTKNISNQCKNTIGIESKTDIINYDIDPDSKRS